MIAVLEIVHFAIYVDISEVGYEAGLEVSCGAATQEEANATYDQYVEWMSNREITIEVVISYTGNPEFWPNGRVPRGTVI